MATATAPAVSPSLPIHRLDLETYGRMVDSGALEGEPVELLEGLLVEVMSPQGEEHAMVIERLTRHLGRAEAWLRVQLPLEVPPDSVPEPDLALVEGPPALGRHPRTVLLAVEVSFSSPRIDRGIKAELYARAGVPTYWLVDLIGGAVEVRTDRGPHGYRGCEIYGLGKTVPSPALGVADLEVAPLLDGLRAVP
jgi:Uma2 family endonuclease